MALLTQCWISSVVLNIYVSNISASEVNELVQCGRSGLDPMFSESKNTGVLSATVLASNTYFTPLHITDNAIFPLLFL